MYYIFIYALYMLQEGFISIYLGAFQMNYCNKSGSLFFLYTSLTTIIIKGDVYQL